jgi:hypothetical protein
MDRFWSLTPRPLEYKRVNEAKESSNPSSSDALEHDEEARADPHRPGQKYSFLAMVAYLFYIPLYIAGPITTFNSFSSCMERRQQSHGMPQLMRMLARVVVMGIALEVSVHFFYYIAISELGLLYIRSQPRTQTVTRLPRATDLIHPSPTSFNSLPPALRQALPPDATYSRTCLR